MTTFSLFPPSPEQRRRRAVLAVAAQVLFVLLVAAAGYAVSHYGRTVALRTSPVDPRDLLRGDYVSLNYDISQVPRRLWRGEAEPRRRRPVYVELQPTAAGYYAAAAVYPAEPATLPTGHVVLRGWISNAWRQGLQLRYGLERYYVPENTGLGLQRQPLLVRVSIAPWGQSRITGIEKLPAAASPR
ncbi:GDYXXLXY domain-containing protein [Hymenobacter sp. 15J16-1T3B]|uniref:GDYXXLXY domain-containing protein n=1 Tax=Hymenobacter sp. 15J16-1T3B TaxID=2886941 RepID=UPI001D115FA7|nr:GDYXXLXY domain-containing protein [Hymenobacter sp. 15J16-1T3B]MCC3156378.1 GDYXXLXY domain-containing protein [Hymenobacter sp. 15J16-1T3B]